MTARTILISILAPTLLAHGAYAQTNATPSGEKRPIELTIRDNQGKLVTVPPGNPAKPVNYVKWLNETLSKGITDNAADTYAEAYQLYQDTKVDDKELDKALVGPWEDLPSVSAWLKANQACLDKFRQATLKRQCYFQLQTAQPASDDHATTTAQPARSEVLISAFLPNLSAHRRICKALIAEGWQEWKRGKEEQLVENTLTVLRTVRHLDDQATTIHNLVASACAGLTYDALRTATSLSRTPDALAGRLAAKLTVSFDPPLDLRQLRGLPLEFVNLRDTGQRFFAPGDKPGTWKVRDGLQAELSSASSEINSIDPTSEKLRADFAKQLDHVGYEATVRETNELARWSQAWLGKPWHEVARGSESFTAKVQKSNNPLIKLMLLDLTRARELTERRIAYRRATHLIVQLHVYDAKNRVFPERLDDLKTPNLKEVRVDPFSGQDFSYKRQGDGFLLYSVAENLKDDGGQHDKSWKAGDFIFWPVQAETR